MAGGREKEKTYNVFKLCNDDKIYPPSTVTKDGVKLQIPK